MRYEPRRWTILLLLFCLAVLPGGAGANASSCDEPIEDVLRTQFSHIQTARLEVIEDEAGWCELWEEVFGSGGAAPPCDTTRVDFTSEVAVVAAQGQKSDGCFDIEIACVERAGRSGNLGIHVVQIEPSGACDCDFVVVTPLHVVKVQRPSRHVRFEVTTFVDPCD